MRRPVLTVALTSALVLSLATLASAQDDMPEPSEATGGMPAPESVTDDPATQPTVEGDQEASALEAAGEDPVILDDSANRTMYGLGARIRGVSTPAFMLDLFFEHHTGGVTTPGFGLQGVRRKANFDIVASFEYSSKAGDDGIWLDSGSDPSTADWVEFEDFGLLSVDFSFIWHRPFSKVVALRYGAGLGAGFRLGKMIQQSTQGCATSNLGDPASCRPAGIVCTAEGCDAAQVKAVRASNNPEINQDVPPVIPVINILLGMRFNFGPHLSLNVETGFRDIGFFFGAGTDYLF